jgi:hypothetical protein
MDKQQQHLRNENLEARSDAMDVDNCQRQQSSNGKSGTALLTPDPVNHQNQRSLIEKRGGDSIVSHLEKFQRQQSDYLWLMTPSGHVVGTDHFQKSVIRSTFPITLNDDDFGYYIDMTFADFPTDLRTRMKDLYGENQHRSTSEDVIFSEHTDGAISATLIQILAQKNDRNELEMLVGSVSLTRQPPRGHRYQQSHWEEHKERVKTALQYIYGQEAQKEISYK